MKLKIKKIIKNLKYPLLVLVSIFIIFEIVNISTDIYNFRQLAIVEATVNNSNYRSGDYRFLSVSEFNKLFQQEITPKDNCYFLVDRNSFFEQRNGGGYIAGFQLKSYVLRLFFLKSYYVYPKYDLPSNIFCTGTSCKDGNYELFFSTISHPCKE